MKISYKSLHRDLGYFYIGLIITFSISGLFLNHRADWHPLNYEYSSKSINVIHDLGTEPIDKDLILEITNSLSINEKLRRFGVDKDVVWVSYENADLEFNKLTGKGTLKEFRITPILGQMTKLHIDTSKFWIYYSDIFAISLLIIALTSMFLPVGKYSFRNYGWKLAVLGVLFPIIFIIFLT